MGIIVDLLLILVSCASGWVFFSWLFSPDWMPASQWYLWHQSHFEPHKVLDLFSWTNVYRFSLVIDWWYCSPMTYDGFYELVNNQRWIASRSAYREESMRRTLLGTSEMMSAEADNSCHHCGGSLPREQRVCGSIATSALYRAQPRAVEIIDKNWLTWEQWYWIQWWQFYHWLALGMWSINESVFGRLC